MNSLILKHYDILQKKNATVYTKDGKWLHPLLACLSEIDKSVKAGRWLRSGLYLDDKVIGLAAALLVVYAEIPKVHGRLMSKMAVEVLEKYEIEYSFDRLVDKLDCQTESFFSIESDPEDVYNEIQKRARKS